MNKTEMRLHWVSILYQLRGQTVQGVTLVGDAEPMGQSALQTAEEVAEDSVDMPDGHGVQEREDKEELRKRLAV